MADIVSLIAGFNPAGFNNENRALDLQNDAQNMQNSRERKIMSLQDQLASNVQDPWGQYRIYNPQGARQTYLAQDEQLKLGAKFANAYQRTDPMKRQAFYPKMLKMAEKAGLDFSDFPAYYDPEQVDFLMTGLSILGEDIERRAELEAQEKARQEERDWDIQILNRRDQLDNQRLDRAFNQQIALEDYRIRNSAQKPPEFKDTERLSANFANRMIESSKILDEFENSGGNWWGAGDDSQVRKAGAGLLSYVPFVGDDLANVVGSDARNNYQSAAKNWVTANLRKESGAAITDEEFKNELIKYFPQPGDSLSTIKQKQRLRKDAEKGMIYQSNGAYNDFIGNGAVSSDPLDIRG